MNHLGYRLTSLKCELLVRNPMFFFLGMPLHLASFMISVYCHQISRHLPGSPGFVCAPPAELRFWSANLSFLLLPPFPCEICHLFLGHHRGVNSLAIADSHTIAPESDRTFILAARLVQFPGTLLFANKRLLMIMIDC